MKLLRKKITYNNTKGEKKVGYNFYIQLDNGYLIPVKNTFKEGYLPMVFSAENYEGK